MGFGLWVKIFLQMWHFKRLSIVVRYSIRLLRRNENFARVSGFR